MTSEATVAAIADIDSVIEKPSGSGMGGSVAATTAAARYYQCICRYCPPGSPYRQQADRYINLAMAGISPSRSQLLLGLLDGLKEEIANNTLTVFEERVRGDVYADFLSMAEGLREEGLYRAAATIAGIALEQQVRKLATKNSIPLTELDPKGKMRPRDASALNNDLKNRSHIYGEAQRATIESYMKVRNDAAHGNPGFEKPDDSLTGGIAPMIMGIVAFIAQHPA